MNFMFDFDARTTSSARGAAAKRPASGAIFLNSVETRNLAEITKECARLLAISGLSTHHQVDTLNCAAIGIEAVVSGQWAFAAQLALKGLRAADEIQGVAPFILPIEDKSARKSTIHNHASDRRVGLKKLHIRLATGQNVKTREEIDQALCLRAMVAAAIAADRGLIHMVKENFGVVIRTLAHEECPFHSAIAWDDELRAYARRHARATVRVP